MDTIILNQHISKRKQASKPLAVKTITSRSTDRRPSSSVNLIDVLSQKPMRIKNAIKIEKKSPLLNLFVHKNTQDSDLNIEKQNDAEKTLDLNRFKNCFKNETENNAALVELIEGQSQNNYASELSNQLHDGGQRQKNALKEAITLDIREEKKINRLRYSHDDFLKAKEIPLQVESRLNFHTSTKTASNEKKEHTYQAPNKFGLKTAGNTSILVFACLAFSFYLFFSSERLFPSASKSINLPETESLFNNSLTLTDIENAPSGDAGISELDSIPELPIMLNITQITVKKGDTLGAIALRYKVSQDSLISMNAITNVRSLAAGSKLKVPNIDGIVYTVRRGDSLGSLSSIYKIDVNKILDANNLESKMLKVGQTLFIPGAKLSSSERMRALGELFVWPSSGRLSSYFGYRSDPFTGVRKFHNGIDLAANSGTRVSAAMAGKVAAVDYNSLYGNYIIIIHADGYQTWYAHLSKTLVKTGQSVKQSQKIAEVGNSGYSTGSHLHFSIFLRGSAINPLKYLK